ncbi:tetratricopeptide repeat protein [Desertifilum sp. FACHB-1129]|uniref:Uncharacterized protein n=2 Tax=Desertifilum tharense IPPAS B-1220 TaxID=1781255 RepID=A0A1E5QJ03_9CYAN|nr:MULTISPECIES: tetratricopeptide repeat protein [Desertifilum]MDA0212557.1 tetratricopeptide repeat protein [Cyanobacteria bacterium FC1]MBD2315052.1 tetratricopeptide repeat protein [Desertifilum sp. FACHB-1129]MBD2324975.1 tetratricopeptide repeat protein [Desertifilum sp. FACHB-866]MBD2335114.1 tetratricopeptide repeat protein [Desertifilum sp. FACHB-868]OEJ74598.1 hypothetical protein BH720_13565 [Desertifilum tharense IPPAS B-1220]
MLRFPRFSYSAMPLVGLGAIAIALGSVPVVQAQTPPAIVAQAENAERYIRLAVEEYQEGNNQAALDALNQAIALNPTMADIYILRGIVRSELNDPQGAIADYSEAIELDGDDAEVYIVRGLAQLALKQYQAAEADFNRALERDSSHADAYTFRGTSRMELNNRQGGLQDFQKAEEIYFAQGNARGLGRLSQALIVADVITFEGGSGDRPENAVIIKGASNQALGVPAQYHYLIEHFGRPDRDWRLAEQSMLNQSDRQYNRMDLQLADGRRQVVYFDITDYYSKGLDGRLQVP